MGFPCGWDGRETAHNEETQVWYLGLEDPLEKGMATYSTILAWRIPWTEEPGGLCSQWDCKELGMTEWLNPFIQDPFFFFFFI